MAQNAAEIETVLPSLSTESTKAFCEDLDGMLGIALSSSQSAAGLGAFKELESDFSALTAVYSVQSKGVLQGSFYLLLDKPGIFILSGLIVMLPEDKIKEQSRRGTLDEAQKLIDSIRETGNLMIGSWDRVYRERMTGHEHFLQIDTKLFSAWKQAEESLGLAPENTCLRVLWDITVPDLPSFRCAAVFPDSLFGPQAAEPQTEEPAPPPAETTEQSPPPPPAETEPQPEPEQPPAGPAPQAKEEPEAKDPQVEKQDSVPEEPKPEDRPVTEAIRELIDSEKESSPAVSRAEEGLDCRILDRPARSVMTTDLLWLDSNTSVETALQQMQSHNTRCALVEEEHRLGGILTRSDLNEAVSPYLKPVFSLYRRPLDDASLQIRIKWFMSRPVHTISPDSPLWKAMEMMCRHDIRALPVQDKEGQVLGLITGSGIFQDLIKQAETGRTQPDCNKSESKPEQRTVPPEEHKDETH